MKKEQRDCIVIGAGPGGYAAAFYLADHGRSVTLIEQDQLGGVCLNRGCIPSKALLHMAALIDESKTVEDHGISFGKPTIQLDALQEWTSSIITQLQGGIGALAAARKVEIIQGRAMFEDNDTIRVETDDIQHFFSFNHVIIATGSRPFVPPVMDLGNPRIMTSTEALKMSSIPKDLLVIGGGYIGMELGSVYASFGSSVSIVESSSEILAGADSDLVKPCQTRAEAKFAHVHVSCTVRSMATKGKKIAVTMVTESGEEKIMSYDSVLVSVGRRANTDTMALDNTDIRLDDNGCIAIDDQCQTNVPNIFAIGDVAGGIQLAHKASKEAKIAASHILGEGSLPLDRFVMPAVVFTDPEIAWVGLTEKEARQQQVPIKVSKFPWSASGRALTLNRTDGLTKIISDPDTGRVLGVGIVGKHAGDLIAEGALAVQSGMLVDDIGETIHPHPTLSETLMESAEHALGVCTHTMPAAKKPG